MAEIRKIQEGMTGAEVADLLDGNFRGLDSDIQKKSQENAVAVNTLYKVLQGVQSTLGTATTDIYGLKLWASETVPGTYATKEALKGYLALAGDAQTVKGTVYFDGAYFNNVPFADVGSKSVRMATMDDVPGFTPLLDEGVEIARVDIGGQQVFLYAPKAASVDLTNYYTKKEVEDYVGQEINTHKEEIAKVALTGSYNDLIDKPAIPSVVDSLASEAVADALSAKQGKVLNDAVGALRTALSLVENSYLDKTNPTVTGNMTVSGLLSAGSLSVDGRAIGSAAFYGVGNTVASGNHELITGGGVYTALQGYATTGALAGYLPTIGGTLTGALRVESMLTVTGVSEIAMLSCPKGLVVGDDQESGQAFKSFTNMFGWNGDGADLTEDWTWMIGKDGRATFGLLNATSLTLADGGVEYAGVYHDDSWGVYLWNEAAQAGIGLTDDGIPHVNGLSVLYVGNYDLYLDGVYARKATTLAGYGITDNVFIPRATLISNENADDLAYNGVYLNATGNGSGNSNFPNLYSAFLNFYQHDKYRAQLSVGVSLWFRRKVDDWEPWRECLDSTNFSDYALPLSGGTMNLNATIKLNRYNTRLLTVSGNDIAFDMSNDTGFWVGGIFLTDVNGVNDILTWEGNATNGLSRIKIGGIDTSTLLHTGNIGSYAITKDGGILNANTGIQWEDGYDNSDSIGNYLSVGADTSPSSSLATTKTRWAAILNVAGNTTFTGYKFQLASYAGGGANSLYYRGYNNNDSQWKSWEEIIHSGNIGSQSVNYANSAGNADTLDGLDSTYMFRLLGTNGNLNFEDHSSKNGVIFIHAGLENYHSDSPFEYGSVLSINSGVSSWMLATNNGSDLFYRNRWWSGGGGNWTSWKKIAFMDDVYTKQQIDDKISALSGGNAFTGGSVVSTIYPSTNGGADLGTSNNRWGSIYASGQSYLGNTEIQGSLGVTGNISAQGNITTSRGAFVGNLSGTASYATSAGSSDTANILNKVYSENINYDAYSSHVKLIKYDDNWQDNGFPNRWTSGLSVQAGYVGWQMLVYGGDADTLYFRKNVDNNTWRGWKAIAFTDSNVASATKLSTARTIWGQSFDGTGDVSGSISGTNFSIYDGSYNPYLELYENGLSVYFQIFGGTAYIGSTNTKSLGVTQSGNVLIGTTTDSGYKLYVNGDSYVNGLLSLGKTGLGYTTRNTLILNPPQHNGGPFYIRNRDDSSNAYIEFTYADDILMTIVHDGRVSIDGSLTVSGDITCNGISLQQLNVDVSALSGYYNDLGALAHKDNLEASDIPALPYLSSSGGDLGGYLTVGGVLTTQSILPAADANYNIGSSTMRYRYLYVNYITGNYNNVANTVRFIGSVSVAESVSAKTLTCTNLAVNSAVTSSFKVKPTSNNSNSGWVKVTNAGTLTGGGFNDDTNALWSVDCEGYASFYEVTQASDINIKNILSDVRLSLGTMANAPLVRFNWKNRTNKKHHVGTIAQYWEDALPEVVSTTHNDTLALAYGELGVAMGISLAKEVQELTEEVQRLRDENRALAQRLNNAGVA